MKHGRDRYPEAEEAILKYEEFHDFEPEDIGHFERSLEVPPMVTHVGENEWVAYRSNKWEKKFHNYIHEHEGDVQCYRTDPKSKGTRIKTPSWIRSNKSFTKIGDCLGFRYTDHDGYPVEAETRNPLPELYCTPDGRCLLVIVDKKKIVALIWGGALGVEDVGIVG